MSSEYPAQATVHKLIGDGKWPATKGEILHINSLEQWQIKLIEMYNQEEIIKQLRQINEKLDNKINANKVIDDLNEDSQSSYLQGIKGFATDFLDDGRLNGSSRKR